MRTVRAAFPKLNEWLNALPGPRCQKMCLYTAAHLWWQILATLLSRSGSRNAFDEQRPSGQAAWNLGELCGQPPEDLRFEGQPSVTCSDNAAHHASRIDPDPVAQIPMLMFHDLLERRTFEDARLFDRWYVMVVDGSVKEKCRQGFEEGGKSATNDARYRYVLQLSVMGPEGTLFPLMHEEMDVHNPETEKEDCELKSFQRLSDRLKKELPKLLIALVADALYGCQAVARCVEAVRRAALAPVMVTVGSATRSLDSWNRNRRRGAAVDRDLTLARLDTEAGKPLAVMVNWTAHPTFMGPEHMEFSGDWPGHLQRTLEALIGEGVTVLFFNGAEGDQSPTPRLTAAPAWEQDDIYLPRGST